MKKTKIEVAEITKSVLKNSNIKSSSDFIVTLYEICKRLNTDMMVKIDPIYNMEYGNWAYSSFNNITHASKRFDTLEYADLVDTKDAYTAILEYFLEDPTIGKLYNMEETDVLGWKIYKELSEKREYCTKLMNGELNKEMI